MRPNPLSRHLFAMAVNDAWANLRLSDALAALPPAVFVAPCPSFFGSIAATANHLLTVDWFYVDAMERARDGAPPHERPAAFFEPELPFEEVEPLADAQRAVDRRLLTLCGGLTDGDLELPVRIRRSTGMSEDPLDRLLAHLFQHQIHHRGQIHQLLSAAGHGPPQLDELFCVGDAPKRARDLARLGLSEDDVFGPIGPPESQ